jgi:hypothetical protein
MLFDSLPPPVRDSLYAAVGLPVVAADELARVSADLDRRLARLWTRVGDLRPRIPVADAQIRLVEERVALLEHRVGSALDRIEEQLPDPARDVVSRSRATARGARSQLRTLVTGAA